MLSDSSRMFVAGSALIGALAAVTIGVRFGTHASSKAADGRVDAWLAPAVATNAPPPGPATPYASAEGIRNAGMQRVLQAVHDSLQRGDLASARVLLDAVLTIRKDEPQALLLKKELAGREEKARDAQAKQIAMESVTASDTPPVAEAKSARQHVAASTRKMHVRMSASRHVDDAERDEAVQDEQPAQNVPHPVVVANTAANTAANPAASAPVIATTNVDTVAAATPEAKVAEAPPAPIEHPKPQPVAIPSPPVEVPQVANNAAPKTRDEVRNELIRARTNGSMSRFGNPDPVGPGGTPDTNAQPDIRLR